MPDIYAQADQFRAALLAKDAAASQAMARAYRQVYLRLKEQLEQLTAKIETAQTLGKVTALGKETATTFSPSWLTQQERLEVLLAQVQAEQATFAAFAAGTITQNQQVAVDLAQAHAQAALATAMGPPPPGAGATATFAVLNKEATADLVGFLADGSPLHDLLAELGPQAALDVRRALLASVAGGVGPKVAARMMAQALAVPLVRAVTISRTETMRAYRESTRRSYLANADVVQGWTWHAGLSTRTCAACWAMAGSFHTVEERLTDHPRGRCVMVPVTKSWADLGFEGVPENPVPPPKRGPDEFTKLTPHQQRQILGPGKLKLYQDGTLNLDDMVAVTPNRAWGPMHHEASIPQAMSGHLKPTIHWTPPPLVPQPSLTTLKGQVQAQSEQAMATALATAKANEKIATNVGSTISKAKKKAAAAGNTPQALTELQAKIASLTAQAAPNPKAVALVEQNLALTSAKLARATAKAETSAALAQEQKNIDFVKQEAITGGNTPAAITAQLADLKSLKNDIPGPVPHPKLLEAYEQAIAVAQAKLQTAEGRAAAALNTEAKQAKKTSAQVHAAKKKAEAAGNTPAALEQTETTLLNLLNDAHAAGLPKSVAILEKNLELNLAKKNAALQTEHLHTTKAEITHLVNQAKAGGSVADFETLELKLAELHGSALLQTPEWHAAKLALTVAKDRAHLSATAAIAQAQAKAAADAAAAAAAAAATPTALVAPANEFVNVGSTISKAKKKAEKAGNTPAALAALGAKLDELEATAIDPKTQALIQKNKELLAAKQPAPPAPAAAPKAGDEVDTPDGPGHITSVGPSFMTVKMDDTGLLNQYLPHELKPPTSVWEIGDDVHFGGNAQAMIVGFQANGLPIVKWHGSTDMMNVDTINLPSMMKVAPTVPTPTPPAPAGLKIGDTVKVQHVQADLIIASVQDSLTGTKYTLVNPDGTLSSGWSAAELTPVSAPPPPPIQAAPALPTSPKLGKIPASDLPFKLDELVPVQRTAGGGHIKQLYENKQGETYMFKPDETAALAEQAGYEVMRLAGLDVPEMWVTTIGGKVGSLQKWHKDTEPVTKTQVAKLNTRELQELQEHMVLDWLIAQHDTNNGAILRRRSDGRLLAVDKGQAFKFLGKDQLDFDYEPNGDGTMYKPLGAAALNRQVTLDRTAVDGLIARLQAIPRAELTSALTPYARHAKAKGFVGTEAELVDAILARQAALVDDVGDLYDRLSARLGIAPTPRRPATFTVLDQAHIDQAQKNGALGKAVMVRGTELENGTILQYEMTHQSTGERLLMLEMKVRREHESQLLGKLDVARAAATGPHVMTEDTLWQGIEPSIIHVAHHLKAGQDGIVLGTKVLGIQGAAKTIVAEYPRATPKVKAMLDHYTTQLTELTGGRTPAQIAVMTPEELAVALKTHWVPGIRKQYLAPAEAAGAHVTTKIPAAKTPKPLFINRTDAAGMLTTDGRLVTWNGRTGSAIGTQGLTIELGAGYQAQYIPHADSSISKQGRLTVTRLDFHGTVAELDDAMAQLRRLGLEAELATPRELELLYLRKTVGAAKLEETPAYRTQVLDKTTATTTTDEAIALHHQFWNAHLRVPDVTQLPQYHPLPRFDEARVGGANTGPGGQPWWHRLEMTEADLERELPNYTMIHSLGGGKTPLEFIRGALANSTALVGTEERHRTGLYSGQGDSPEADQGTGGADYVFTRLRSSRRGGSLQFDKRLLLRTNILSYYDDYFGKTAPEFQREHRRVTPAEWRQNAGGARNETTIKHRIPLLEYLTQINAGSAAAKDEILRLLREAGITTINGRPIAQVVKA